MRLYSYFWILLTLISVSFSFSGSNKLFLNFYIDRNNIYMGAKAGFLPKIKIKFNDNEGICGSEILDTTGVTLCQVLNDRMRKIYNRFKSKASDIDTLNILILEKLYNDELKQELTDLSKNAGFEVVNIYKMNKKSFRLLGKNKKYKGSRKVTIRYNKEKDFYYLERK